MTRPNKLESSSLETLSCQVLEFEGKARANQIGAPEVLQSKVGSWPHPQTLD